MKGWTLLVPRRHLAVAMPASSATKQIGSSHSRLNQRVRPTRTRGAMPCATGTDPAHVSGSTMSSPTVN